MARAGGHHSSWQILAFHLAVICVAGWMLLLHLVQIACWAVCYKAAGALPDLASAFYFSMVCTSGRLASFLKGW